MYHSRTDCRKKNTGRLGQPRWEGQEAEYLAKQYRVESEPVSSGKLHIFEWKTIHFG